MAVLGEALSHFVLISAVFYHVAARQPSSSRCVSVVLDHAANALKLVDGYHPNSSVAWGNFTEIQQQTGWNYLTVSTSPEYNDTFQAYAAGLVEGFLTADYIYMEWFNTQASFCHTMTPDCEKIKSFLGENLEWMKQQVELNPDDPYFYQVHQNVHESPLVTTCLSFTDGGALQIGADHTLWPYPKRAPRATARSMHISAHFLQSSRQQIRMQPQTRP